jgi:uncharacterized protein YbjT (DUF2867 family)
MKVLIIGATGQIGRLTIREALNLGHEVTAVGRSVERIKPEKGLQIVKADVQDANSILNVVAGHDVVVLTFGAMKDFKTLLLGTQVCEVGTKNVVAAMKHHGIRRLVAMTSIGAGDSSGHGSWVFRNIIKPVLLGRIIKDRTAQEEWVRTSGLPEWVIVRPAVLNDNERSTQLRTFTAFDGQSEPSTIARASVAAFLAKAIADRTYDGRSVLITD